jgi:nuclear transport factor 2 (NTF2) superfamily protein
VLAAEAAWNTRDPARVASAYTIDSVWRNRCEFIEGREQIVAFLRARWDRELDYALRKELWAFSDDRIAVRFQYEWHDTDGQWFRSYGNENWEFDEQGSCGAAGEHQRRPHHRRRATHTPDRAPTARQPGSTAMSPTATMPADEAGVPCCAADGCFTPTASVAWS